MAHNYDHRHIMIFNVSELDSINFSEVIEDSISTVRRSVDETLTIVKWDSETVPPTVEALTTKEGAYTYTEALEIMQTPVWSDPEPIME